VGFRSAGVVAAWTFAGIVVSQLVFVLVSQVAAGAGAETQGTPQAAVTAANAAWSYAFLVYMLPHGLLAVSLVTAVFTRVSGAAQAGDTAGVAASTRSMMRVLLVGITLPAAGLVLFSSEITALLFLEFGDKADVVGDVMVAMALGLPFFSVLYLVRRVFYAYEDGRTPFFVTLATAGVWAAGTLVAPLVLPPTQWVTAVAASMSLGEVAGLVAAVWFLHRRIGDLGVRGFLWVLLRLLLVLAVVGPLALVAGRAVGGTGSQVEALLTLLVGGGVLVVGYLVGTRLLRVAETSDLISSLTSRFARAGGRSSSTS